MRKKNSHLKIGQTIVLLAILLVTVLTLGGCGYTSTDNELIGQVKKVQHQTPLLCPNRYDADVSLGVMRGGVGSMSTQDVWFTVDNVATLQTLQNAVESGKLVRIHYNVYRVVFCVQTHEITKVDVID